MWQDVPAESSWVRWTLAMGRDRAWCSLFPTEHVDTGTQMYVGPFASTRGATRWKIFYDQHGSIFSWGERTRSSGVQRQSTRQRGKRQCTPWGD
jgi:hypothetical protein